MSTQPSAQAPVADPINFEALGARVHQASLSPAQTNVELGNAGTQLLGWLAHFISCVVVRPLRAMIVAVVRDNVHSEMTTVQQSLQTHYLHLITDQEARFAEILAQQEARHAKQLADLREELLAAIAAPVTHHYYQRLRKKFTLGFGVLGALIGFVVSFIQAQQFEYTMIFDTAGHPLVAPMYVLAATALAAAIGGGIGAVVDHIRYKVDFYEIDKDDVK
jgi:hypothetical protein